MDEDHNSEEDIDLQVERKDEENLTEEQKSALHKSIKEYGQYSYYYAHKPKEFDIGKGKRFEGSGIIHGESPALVHIEESSKINVEKKPQNKRITKYSWNDEKAKVKIYIDLEDILESKDITENNIDFKVEETSLAFSIIDHDSNIFLFEVKKLYDKVEPEKCKYIISKDKIKIILHKWIETKWKELAAKK
mmetsp:Transcript_29468/g.33755  ORF Transcript_29468/g.33755 Transcript_29468/m.33755 type:complete len:191 (-) Transcript_29468:42-614(-)